MLENIVVAVLCLIVVSAGVWCWWYENYGEVIAKDEDNQIVTEENR